MRSLFQPTPYQLPSPVYLANQKFNDRHSSIDFYHLESILWRIKTDENNQLVIDADLLNQLQQITGLLSAEQVFDNTQRLKLLITKSMPGDSGETLSLLVSQHRAFARIQKIGDLALQSASINLDLDTLQQAPDKNRRRQIKFFGESAAKQLFARQNKVWDLLIDTQSKQVAAKLHALARK